MFTLQLKLKKYRDGRLSYGVPFLYRLFLAFIGIILLTALILSSPDANTLFNLTNIIPMIFVLLSLLAALYQDQWSINRKTDIITYKNGLLFLYRSQTYCLHEVKTVELVLYRKCGNTKSFFRNLPGQKIYILYLHLEDGRKINMETGGPLKDRPIFNTGKMIAEYCNVPFIHKNTDTGL